MAEDHACEDYSCRCRICSTSWRPAQARTRSYQNARQHSDKQNARIEHDRALLRVMTALLKDDTQLFKQFSDDESFRRWLTNMVFGLTYAE